MKKMIIITAVLLMLTGGVISVMKTMEIGPFASETTDAEAQDAGEGEDGDAPEPRTAAPRFIDMEPLIIPIFDDQKVVTTI
jgi:flagellar basal body-associated protein FliL